MQTFLSIDDVVPAFSQKICVARNQVPFQGARLVIADESARNFTLECIRIGNVYPGANSGAVPIEAFAARWGELPDVVSKVAGDGTVELHIAKPMAAFLANHEFVLGMPIPMPRAEVGTEHMLVVTNNTALPHRFVAMFIGTRLPSRFD